MQLIFLTALTMVAFAANSVLNRMAVFGQGMDPVQFAVLRLIAGAVVLAALVLWRQGKIRLGGPGRAIGVLALLVYIFGFSLAYVRLDAGLGALLLFGTVQLTMFTGALWGGERPPARRWIGSALASAGLVWLLWPGAQSSVSFVHALCMVCAGVGWGFYSLVGRGAGDAMMSTAANFLWAAPVALIAVFFAAHPGLFHPTTPAALVLAIASGAVTSGLGYALWYSLLPRLNASTAAVSQLTVPTIATAGGMLFLGEALTLRFAGASLLILGGVAWAVLTPKDPNQTFEK